MSGSNVTGGGADGKGGEGSNFGGFGFGIGISVGILLLITAMTLVTYYCTRVLQPAASAARMATTVTVSAGVRGDRVVDVGMDDVAIQSLFPKLVYSEVNVNNGDPTTASCCTICLADYKATDTLRLLPDCGHLFHLKCVDPWLRMNPTCPVCRSSPVPTPLSTPLAEVIPLATRRG